MFGTCFARYENAKTKKQLSFYRVFALQGLLERSWNFPKMLTLVDHFREINERMPLDMDAVGP